MKKILHRHSLIFFMWIVLVFSITSCSKPAETKEEFIQKGIIMSDTLLKNLDKQLLDAQLRVDSAIKSGLFVPPPPPSTSPAVTTNTTSAKTK